MAIRPSVVQVVEIGVETSQGTTADPTRQLRSLTWDLTPQSEIDELRASGSKYVTMTAQNREWTTGSIGGEPDYNELTYLFASVVGNADVNVAGTGGGGTAYQWDFESDSTGLDTFDTYTIVKGDANHGERVVGVIVDAVTLDFTRQDASVSGSFLAGRLEAGVPVSGTAVFISDQQRPVLPGHVNVYLDDAYDDIGDTQLLRDFRFMFEISGRHTAVWPLDRAQDSYAFTVEGPPTVGATLQLMADGTATDILDTMRVGDTLYVRAEAVGGTTTAGTVSYSLIVDAALQVISAPSMSDLDDLYVWEWGFRVVDDQDLEKAFSVTLINAMDALS